MMSVLGDIGFARPWAFALAFCPLLVLLAPPLKSAIRWVPPQVVGAWIEAVAARGGARGGGFAASGGRWLVIAGWMALILALAGPETRGATLTPSSGRDLFFAIDVSASMAVEDMTAEGAPIPRIDVARRAVESFLKARAGDRLGLIAFATEAYLVTPLTDDAEAASMALYDIPVGLPGRRTDLGRAIGLATRVVENRPEGRRLLVMLTDGQTNAGDLNAFDAANLAAAAGIRIELIGFGGLIEPENAALMREVAARAGGGYHEAHDPDALRAVLGEVSALAPLPGPEAAKLLTRDLSAPFIGAALLAALALAWRERGAA